MSERIIMTVKDQPRNCWAVIATDTEGVHVVPWDDSLDMPGYGHAARAACDCRPTPKRDAPLDEPVWSHHEPSWPGSSDYLA